MNIYLVLRVQENIVRSVTATFDRRVADDAMQRMMELEKAFQLERSHPKYDSNNNQSDAAFPVPQSIVELIGQLKETDGIDDFKMMPHDPPPSGRSDFQIAMVSLGFQRKPGMSWWKSLRSPQWDVVITGAQERV